MPPSLADPQGSLRAALTPGRSRDVDWGGCVVVSIVPAPQELCADPQSACPAQGLNTSDLQQRHCQLCPPRSTLLAVHRKQRSLQEQDRIPDVSPGVTPVRMPSLSSGLQPPSVLRPILTISTVINRLQPFLLRSGTEQIPS